MHTWDDFKALASREPMVQQAVPEGLRGVTHSSRT